MISQPMPGCSLIDPRHINVSASTISCPALLRYAYYAFVFSVPFDAVSVQYISSGTVTLSKLIGYALVAITLIYSRESYQRSPKVLPYFAAYLIAFLVLGIAGGASLSDLRGPIFTFAQLFVLFVISFNLLRAEKVATGALWSLALSATALAALQAVGFTEEIIAQDRVTTAGENPNKVAAILALGLLAFTGLAYSRQHQTVFKRAVFGLCALVLISQMARTGSRGAAIAFALALMALFLRRGMRPRWRVNSKVTLVVVVSSLLCILVYVSSRTDAIRQRWMNTLNEGDTAGRDIIYARALDMFLERPLLGWGPVTHRRELGRRLGVTRRDTHNLYLFVLNEVGILGAAPFLLALWHCWRSSMRARRGLQGGLPMALLLFTLVINAKGTYHGDKFFWLVLAYVTASATYPHVVGRGRRVSVQVADLVDQSPTRYGRLQTAPVSE